MWFSCFFPGGAEAHGSLRLSIPVHPARMLPRDVGTEELFAPTNETVFRMRPPKVLKKKKKKKKKKTVGRGAESNRECFFRLIPVEPRKSERRRLMPNWFPF